jgi:hypothetical protein
VVRAALDDDVARLQEGFGVIQDKVHLTLEDDAVVDRPGAVHRRAVTGRHVHHTDDGSVRGRRELEGAIVRLARLASGDAGGRAGRVPDLDEHLPIMKLWRGSIGQDD